MPVAGNIVRDLWFYKDLSEVALLGMTSPADVTLTLKRDIGAGFGNAPEAVTWTERGGGYYEPSFIPLSGGLYRLFLKELNPNSFQLAWTFAYEIVSAGSVFLPSFANAFCSESDVERWTQLLFDATSKPTSTEVAGFCQARASEMRSVLAGAGWSVSPSSIVANSVEQDMARECNAIGAAADSFMAKFMDTEPAETKKAVALLEEYSTRLGRLRDYALSTLGQSKIRTPMTSGELTLRDEANTTDSGLRDAIRMDTRW